MNNSACMAPMEYPVMFDSWYECSRTAHQESIRIMNKMGYKEVNDYQIAMKYNCKPVRTY